MSPTPLQRRLLRRVRVVADYADGTVAEFTTVEDGNGMLDAVMDTDRDHGEPGWHDLSAETWTLTVTGRPTGRGHAWTVTHREPGAGPAPEDVDAALDTLRAAGWDVTEQVAHGVLDPAFGGLVVGVHRGPDPAEWSESYRYVANVARQPWRQQEDPPA